MVDLGKWLLEVSSRHRVDGVWDCAQFPAEWAVMNGYDNPAKRWTWATESEALDLIDGAGGIVPLFDDGLLGAGLERRAGQPQLGDIGIVTVRGESAGGIFTGKRWALVGERGLVFVTLGDESVDAVWAVDRG